MISENGEPISPTGAVPAWSHFDQVRITASWCDRQNQTGTVVSREYMPNVDSWRYGVQFEHGIVKYAVEAEMACAVHNDRGSREFSGRKIRIECTCGHVVRTEYKED